MKGMDKTVKISKYLCPECAEDYLIKVSYLPGQPQFWCPICKLSFYEQDVKEAK